MERYPAGFADDDLNKIRSKHKIEKMTAMAHELLAPERFENREEVAASIVKIVSSSSLVSLYEKPKFKDFVGRLGNGELELLTMGYYEQLHGDRVKGFHMLLDVLSRGKLAKWTLITLLQYYYYPHVEVFIKPTTCKDIIKVFDLKGLVYNPMPSLEFYEDFKEQIITMKAHVNPDLAPDNGAFTGFLMLSMEGMMTND